MVRVIEEVPDPEQILPMLKELLLRHLMRQHFLSFLVILAEVQKRNVHDIGQFEAVLQKLLLEIRTHDDQVAPQNSEDFPVYQRVF